MHEILLNVESKEIRYAYLKHGQLHDLIVERKKSRQMTGNIYRGRVTHILHNIQSAFIDIHEGENGFVHISDILENRKKFEEMFEIDFAKNRKEKEEKKEIEQLLKVDQPVLVQVIKEPIGTKGARLTSNVSVAGRYLVLLPNQPHRGVSRKIEDRETRDRLRQLIASFEMPQDMGLICRTASAEASEEALVAEANDLFHTWQGIVEKFNGASGPMLLLEESDLVKRALVQCIDKKWERLLVDDYAVYQRCKQLYSKYAAEHSLKIEFYRDKVPMFERFNMEKEIDRATRRKVWLGSGGYLFFDRTEAMHTIDVNSGRSSSSSGSSDLEESLVQINLEAAEEIARQLRIRNVGGLIICDFIDMESKKNQRRVLERLRECMKEDSAKCTILGMSEFGLVEMTRQRSRESLSQTLQTACPYCSGSGQVKSHESLSIEIERALKKAILVQNQFALKLVTHPELDHYLEMGDKEYLKEMAIKSNARLEFGVNDALHLNDYFFSSTLNGQRIDT
ncbi:MAG: ribonuclease E/G [Verrucomicrobiota bacterium]|nr:ribonuclease E/G [Verrucomicrobiota bacterium]